MIDSRACGSKTGWSHDANERQTRDNDLIMPNIFASLVLYSYPLVVFLLFRRLDRPQALIWSIMAGYLFLPEQTGIDLPLLPALDKTLIPSLSAAVMCLDLPERPGGSRRAGARVKAQGRMSHAVRGDRLRELGFGCHEEIDAVVQRGRQIRQMLGQRDDDWDKWVAAPAPLGRRKRAVTVDEDEDGEDDGEGGGKKKAKKAVKA